jgi:hypothetical protein
LTYLFPTDDGYAAWRREFGDMAMNGLREQYRGLLGRKLDSLLFYCYPTSETPDVVANLRNRFLWLGGAICLRFDDVPSLSLTWKQGRDNCNLTGDNHETLWLELDRINASPEEPWGALHGATLLRVSFFTCNEVEGPIAVRHDFKGTTALASLWVGVGYERDQRICDADDLYVGLDDPKNVSELPLLETMEF